MKEKFIEMAYIGNEPMNYRLNNVGRQQCKT